ncbi:MAG: hypothetical protein ACYTG6_10305 [Planctomycetota bacterium]|jgi:hypothetical protein
MNCHQRAGCTVSLRPHFAQRAALFLILVSALGCLVACGDREPVEIVDTRELPTPRERVPEGVTSEQRFGTGGGHGHGAPPESLEPEWAWEAPEGWTELPPKPLREVGFMVGGSEDAECTFSVLTGSGGGLAANVNRWRTQMGLEEVTAEEIDALPKRAFLGREAVYVELDGKYGGMHGDQDVQDAKLIGLILQLPQAALFVKMTGPAAVLEGERGHFDAFAGSIRLEQRASTPPPERAPTSSLRWTAPEGWVRQPDRMMREVTFVPEGATGTECYVTILGGAAGGAVANIDRWRQQIGLEPMGEGEFEALPRMSVLGGQAVWVALRGHYRGMGDQDQEEAMLLGFVRERGEDTVFVKMTGPAAEVEPQQSAFEAFCASLRE